MVAIRLQRTRVARPMSSLHCVTNISSLGAVEIWLKVAFRPNSSLMLMLMLINSIYPRANLVTEVTTAAPWGLSSVNCRTVLVSTTVTLGMAVVHSNIWDQKLWRHVNQMWQSLYVGSQDRLGLLLADDEGLWQLTVVRTEMTDMMGPAHVDICRRAGKGIS